MFILLALIETGCTQERSEHAFWQDPPASENLDATPEVQEVANEISKKSRRLWLWRTRGENIALGKPVKFYFKTDYNLTADEQDQWQLTDGKLAMHPVEKTEKLWFDRQAVGSAGKTTRTFNIDLGSVQPVDRVVVRYQGGRDQACLIFPTRIDVLVSVDGENYMQAGRFDMIGPVEGETMKKDESSPWQRFHLPETGESYTYPFCLPIRTKARYVALRAAGAELLCMDEMAVIKGDFNAGEKNYDNLQKVFVATQGAIVAPLKDKLYIANNIPAPSFFLYQDLRETKQAGAVKFVFELPEQVSVLSTALTEGVIKEKIKRDSKPFVRWTFNNIEKIWQVKYYKLLGPFYLKPSSNVNVDNLHAWFRTEAEGFEPNEIMLPIRFLDLPEVPRLRNFLISLAWMKVGEQIDWPGFSVDFQKLGFNSIGCFPREWTEQKRAAYLAHIDVAKKNGMKMIYNESPFHVMEGKHRNEKEMYSKFADGKIGKGVCPAYRGKYYQEELVRVKNLCSMVKPDWVMWDSELWRPGVGEANKCEVCQKGLKESGKQNLSDYLCGLGVEIQRDLRDVVKKSSEENGFKMPKIGSYHVHAKSVSQGLFDLNKLYPDILDASQDSLYTDDIQSVRKSILADHAFSPKRISIPYLTMGYGSSVDCDPHKVELILLECIMNGAQGFVYFCFNGFDSPLDYYHHAKAMREIQPYEELLWNGTAQTVECDNKHLTVSAWGTSKEMLVLVGNYANSIDLVSTLALPLTKISEIKEVRHGLPVNRNAKIKVPGNDAVLIYVRGGK
jgi:hypothetical protein